MPINPVSYTHLVRFADEDLWLTQNQLAEIYDTTQQNISQHIEGIYQDKELDRKATNKKFLLVRNENVGKWFWQSCEATYEKR